MTCRLRIRRNSEGRSASWPIAVFLAAIAVVSLVGCGDEDDSGDSSSPTPSMVATASTEPARTPSAVAEVPSYGPEARTGVASIDQILVSILAADRNDVRARLEYVEVPCTASGKAIPGPVCPENVAVGTTVLAFRLTGCESTYERKDTIGPVVEGFVVAGLRLFAVHAVDSARAGHEGSGDFGLVFIDTRLAPGQQGVRMVAVSADTQGRILRWTTSCGTTNPQAFLADRPVASYVLPPR